MDQKDVLYKIAYIHGELIMIHPFRDGNGRVTRMLCDLLLLQSRREPVSHKLGDKKFRHHYYNAIRQVWSSKDYSGLEAILNELLSF